MRIPLRNGLARWRHWSLPKPRINTRRLGVATMLLFTLGLIAAFTLPFGLRAYTALRFDRHIYTVDDVEARPVAIIFGAQVRHNGRLSTMLADRVRTGADLYHAGKVDRLLMSGDNQSPDYNEPDAMRRFAIELGVPPDAIDIDRLGLRTYDTCHRAQDLFGIDRAILVTQDFHLDRALLVCNALGIDAVGVFADYHRPNGYSDRAMGWSTYREIAATTVALIDILRRPTPQGTLSQD